MKGKKVDGHFTIHHNTWDEYIDSGKDLLRWSFRIALISLVLIIIREGIKS